ncbi:hypothetical protein TWF706_007503 [Orbilia oligospora]|nr:hypothetical protein TWF706_007503 [Orbilia oligospora]
MAHILPDQTHPKPPKAPGDRRRKTHHTSDNELAMAGSVPYIPLPQSQNPIQPVGLALSRHFRGKLRVSMAGHGISTAVSHRSRRERQKAHYYNELDMTATIGQEADLASQVFENADVLKLIYGVCNGYPDDTERVDGFLKAVLLRWIPKYFQHPLRPPPKSLAIRETWQSGPRLLTNTSSTATSAIQNHYARLLMIARDGGWRSTPLPLVEKKRKGGRAK